jgi:hypothetical protein
MTSNCENIARQARLSLWIIEMDNSSIVLDHVNFFNPRNRIDRKLFQCRLQFLVISGSRLMNDLLLAAWAS